MNDLVIEKTKSSPEVNFNASTGKWRIVGSSYPENASEFYNPIFVWINKYITEVTQEIFIDFQLDYLNSSSIKFIGEMVDKLDKYGKIGVNVEINWHYKEEDEDILDLGNELKEEVSCKFNIIED
jgi:hypothetical protein